jgi:hypothetical protein
MVSPPVCSWMARAHCKTGARSVKQMQRQSTIESVRARAIAAALILTAAGAAPLGQAHAQSAASIAVEGNRRVEAATIRSYFQAAAGASFLAGADQAALRLSVHTPNRYNVT